MIFVGKTIASAIYSEYHETSEISLMYHSRVSQPMPVLWRGHDLYLVIQVHSEDLMIREKSHDSRFFCILRSLSVTCKQA